MIETKDFSKGAKLEIDGYPFEIVSYEHVKPGKGNAFVRTKLKNLKNGNVIERTYKSGTKVKKADVVESSMQYLYQDKDEFYFMDNTSFEQVSVSGEIIGDAKFFLKENDNVDLLFFNGDPIGINLPKTVVMQIVKTPPGFKGDTNTGGKPATIETGATIQVPFFIKEGDKIKIDTRTKAYIERVNK